MAAALIELGDPPAAWARLGFAPDAAGEVVLGEARVRLGSIESSCRNPG
jgi:hypothetical protein